MRFMRHAPFKSGISRRHFLRTSAVFSIGASAILPAVGAPKSRLSGRPIPVILDADIGDDIDDTWALGFLLKCPELDLKLVVGDYGMPDYRTRLIAKMLDRAGRTDVPIGLGLDVPVHTKEKRQWDWVEDYPINKYSGKVHKDGVQAIIDTIMNARQPITVLGIGPLPNISKALELEPRIARRARFVGMHGSVRRGYNNSEEVAPEYNVVRDPAACRKTLSAPWDITITPLDTCGLVTLESEEYRVVRDSQDPVAKAIIENYRIWSKKQPEVAEKRSSVLFDTVAVYLAFEQTFCKMEKLGIRVTGDGYTRIDPEAKVMNVATQWKDLPAFRRFLVQRLTGKTETRTATVGQARPLQPA